VGSFGETQANDEADYGEFQHPEGFILVGCKSRPKWRKRRTLLFLSWPRFRKIPEGVEVVTFEVLTFTVKTTRFAEKGRSVSFDGCFI
jgi:hypothetical protein